MQAQARIRNKEKTESLTQIFQKISAEIYQQAAQQHQQQQQAAGAGGSTDESWQGNPSDDTINADYKVKDEKKKKDDKKD